MKTLKNLLKNKHLRCLYDKTTNEYWFCAVDICQILCNTKYDTAKSYWKTTKQRTPFFMPKKGYINKRLSLPANDGKLYKMDVITIKTVLFLIKIIKHKNSITIKLFLLCYGRNKIIEILNKFAAIQTAKVIEYFKTSGKKASFSETWIEKIYNVSEDTEPIPFKPRVVEPSCLAYAILAPLALSFVDLHKSKSASKYALNASKIAVGCDVFCLSTEN